MAEAGDVKIIPLEYQQAMQADSMLSPGPSTFGLTTFRVTNVRWSSRRKHKHVILEESNEKFKKGFTKSQDTIPRISFIGARKNKGERQARELLVHVENTQFVTTAALKAALQETFHIYDANRTRQIEAIAHKDLKMELGYDPHVIRQGHAGISLEEGLASKNFDGVEGAFQKSNSQGHTFHSGMLILAPARPFCNLCDCRYDQNHEGGKQHRFFLKVLKKVNDLYHGNGDNSAFATLKCPICPIGNITSLKHHLEHTGSPRHVQAEKIKNKFFSYIKFYEAYERLPAPNSLLTRQNN